MRVCPKCGHIDPGEWKHTKFSYYIDQCSYENFQVLHPKLALKLDDVGKQTEDDNYIYYRTKSGFYVLRKAKIDIGLASSVWTDGLEKHHRGWPLGRSKLPDKTQIRDLAKHWDRLNPNQKKLLEIET